MHIKWCICFLYCHLHYRVASKYTWCCGKKLEMFVISSCPLLSQLSASYSLGERQNRVWYAVLTTLKKRFTPRSWKKPKKFEKMCNTTKSTFNVYLFFCQIPIRSAPLGSLPHTRNCYTFFTQKILLMFCVKMFCIFTFTTNVSVWLNYTPPEKKDELCCQVWNKRCWQLWKCIPKWQVVN